MKKGLLSILGAALASATFATGDGITLYKPYLDSVNQKYAATLDVTNRQIGIKGLTANSTKDMWQVATWGAADMKQSGAVVDNKLVINQERITAGTDNWQGIDFSLAGFQRNSTTSSYKTDTVVGMFVDLTGNVVLSAKVETNYDCYVRFDIIDANGANGNCKSPGLIVKAGAADTYLWTWDEDSLMNWYADGITLGGIKNGLNGTTSGIYFTKASGDSVMVKWKAQSNIPVDASKIVKISMAINDAKKGTKGEQIVCKFSEMVIGDAANAVQFEKITTLNKANSFKIPYPSKFDCYEGGTIPTKGKVFDPEATADNLGSASALTVYPNPAKGQITVSENVTVTTLGGIATGVAGTGVLDISSLVAGTYKVVGTTGNATLVVE